MSFHWFARGVNHLSLIGHRVASKLIANQGKLSEKERVFIGLSKRQKREGVVCETLSVSGTNQDSSVISFSSYLKTGRLMSLEIVGFLRCPMLSNYD